MKAIHALMYVMSLMRIKLARHILYAGIVFARVCICMLCAYGMYVGYVMFVCIDVWYA